MSNIAKDKNGETVYADTIALSRKDETFYCRSKECNAPMTLISPSVKEQKTNSPHFSNRDKKHKHIEGCFYASGLLANAMRYSTTNFEMEKLFNIVSNRNPLKTSKNGIKGSDTMQGNSRSLELRTVANTYYRFITSDLDSIINGVRIGDMFACERNHKQYERSAKGLESGQYVPQSTIDNAAKYEHKELAEKLWYLHQDKADGCEFFIDESIFKGGFPNSTEHIAGLLSQPEQRETIISGLQEFNEAYKSDHSLLRFHSHKPNELLQRLSDLRTEPKVFSAGEIASVNHVPFITQDQIQAYLSRGSSIEGGKLRNYSYFLQEHNIKEKAEFLKNEHGTGGHSHALSGVYNTNADYSSKGLTLSIGSMLNPLDKVDLSWSKVAQYIDNLIKTEKYMTSAELDRIPEDEKEKLVQLSKSIEDQPEQLSIFSMSGAEEPAAEKKQHTATHAEVKQTSDFYFSAEPMKIEAISSNSKEPKQSITIHQKEFLWH